MIGFSSGIYDKLNRFEKNSLKEPFHIQCGYKKSSNSGTIRDNGQKAEILV